VAWEGMLYKSDGSPICGLQQGLRTPEQGTRIFAGDTADIAWTSDIRLDPAGRPYVAYSVRKVHWAPRPILRGTITVITTHVGMGSNTRRSSELILPRPEPG